MAATSERLPWLNDEPAAAGSATPAKKKPGGAMWPWYLLLALVIAAVVAGAWWLSTAKEAAPPELPAEQSIPIPVTQPAPVEPGAELIAADPAEQAAPAPQSLPATTSPRPVRRSAERSVVPSEPGEAENPDGAAGRSIFPADDVATTLPAPGPSPVPAYNPRPYGGRVVQLGAFPTRAQAEAIWQRITRRYPYLTTKPKMVNTVDVRGLGGGRPTRMYRLQLGTSSQAQSVVICQQLERAGHSCVVVY